MNKKNNTVLFIVEGEVAEPTILNGILSDIGLCDNQIYSYKTNIYSLYHKLRDTFDDDEEYDLFTFIVDLELEKNNPDNIIKFKRKQISEIYLFFDYDGHDPEYSNEKISQMIEIFNNETENGKLYISYPMVEALKHIKKDNLDINNYLVEAKTRINYKNLVSLNTDYENLLTLSKRNWLFIISENLKRCLFLFELKKSIDYAIYNNIINQKSIFNKQLDKYILKEEKVLVLSAFPFFLLEYFGEEFFSWVVS
mgnify:CR=1 FL=1